VSGGCRFDLLAAVLPDPVRYPGPAPDHADEDHTRCGDGAVAGLNEALLAKAAAAKLLRTDKVRADTTVVEAAVAYPTIRVCWPRRSVRWPAPWRGSKPPAAQAYAVTGSAPLGRATSPLHCRQAEAAR